MSMKVTTTPSMRSSLGAVGHGAAQERFAVAGARLALDRRQVVQHAARVLEQRVACRSWLVMSVKRPVDVGGDEAEQARGRRREALDAQLRGRGTASGCACCSSRLPRSLLSCSSSATFSCSSALTVVSSSLTDCSSSFEVSQLLVAGLQLLVDRHRLLVGDLQLLVGGLQLLDRGRAARAWCCAARPRARAALAAWRAPDRAARRLRRRARAPRR